jgi:NAD(P)-dependent dehydrogenase (short-subunit alcohol dehydrogenase family)
MIGFLAGSTTMPRMHDTQRVALVTGGNRGIGLEIARQLAQRGLSVLLGSRDLDAGRSAADALAREGLAVHARKLDVTRDEDIDALARSLEADPGGLHVLVNNAGIAMDGFNAHVARTTLEVNFFSLLRITDRLLPLLRRGGRVVMLTSGLGDTSDLPAPLQRRLRAPDLGRDELLALMQGFVDAVAAGKHRAAGWPSSAYRVSKMGVNALTAIYGRELAKDPRGILCNAVCPGWVRTAMGGANAPRSVEEGAETPVYAALLAEEGPQGSVLRDGAVVSW